MARFAILALVLWLGGQNAARHYFPVAPSAMAHNFHTHVEVTGKVALSKRQHDGDWHIRLFDPGHSVPHSKTRIAGFGIVVAECIPELPCLHPKVGDCVKVRGISRFDGEHKWYEVHPVEHLEVVACRN